MTSFKLHSIWNDIWQMCCFSEKLATWNQWSQPGAIFGKNEFFCRHGPYDSRQPLKIRAKIWNDNQTMTNGWIPIGFPCSSMTNAWHSIFLDPKLSSYARVKPGLSHTHLETHCLSANNVWFQNSFGCGRGFVGNHISFFNLFKTFPAFLLPAFKGDSECVTLN